MKLFYFDLETTGVDASQHGIHQIAAIIETPDGMAELNYKVRPREGCMVSPEALELGGVTLEEIRDYPSMAEVYRDLVRQLSAACNRYDRTDKLFLVGFNNAGFDNQFLRRFFLDCGDLYFGSYFWPNSLDVFVLATLNLIEKRPTMANFKLRTVAETLGLTVDESRLHDALYDVQLTKAMFEILARPKTMEAVCAQ
jgi:DNA polymerase-3 subunit epsilon